MNQQVTIQLSQQAYNQISTLASKSDESVESYISNFVMQMMSRHHITAENNAARKIAEKKACLHSLRGIAADSSITDEEARDEYIKEKYGV